MQNGTMEERHGALRWLAREISGTLFVALLLFGTAGRWNWVGGWLTVGLYAGWVLANTVLIMPRSPGLLAERGKKQSSPNPVDNTLLALFGVMTMVKYIAAGLQARWQPASGLGTSFLIIGLVVSAFGYGLVTWAMVSNAYFSMVVRIQAERNQTVIQHGPYRLVRHPGYLGSILFELASPLMLGMSWALFPGLINALVLVFRTGIEDSILHESLQGYADYSRKVRFRLLPWIW